MDISAVAKYWKGIIAFGGAITALGQALADGSVSAEEAGLVVTAFVTAAGVLLKSNKQ